MILAVYNPKGGCGKTTTAVNLATELARRGRSVLLVDLEADMGSSISVGVGPSNTDASIFELLLNQRRPSDAVRPVAKIPNLHLVAGSPAQAGAIALQASISSCPTRAATPRNCSPMVSPTPIGQQ